MVVEKLVFLYDRLQKSRDVVVGSVTLPPPSLLLEHKVDRALGSPRRPRRAQGGEATVSHGGPMGSQEGPMGSHGWAHGAHEFFP